MIGVYLTRIYIVCCMGKDPLLLMWLVVVSFVIFGPLARRARVIMVFVRISLSTSLYRVLSVLILYDR